MPRDEAARRSSRSAMIKVPDQLQQTKRLDETQRSGDADVQREASATPPQEGGILGQLRTERAHD